MNNPITRKEITWWQGMIVVIVSIAIWGSKLESTVKAMQEKGVTLREDTESYMIMIQEDIRTIKNIQIDIAKKLDITVKY